MPSQQTDIVRYIPAGQLHYRDGNALKDVQYKNCFRESISNPQNNTATGYTIKRDGMTLLASVAPNGSEARGCYYWDKTNKIYAAYGNTLYSLNTNGTGSASLVTLQGTTGLVGFVEFIGLVSYLVVSDGIKLYIIDTSNVVDTLFTDQLMRITVTDPGTGYATPPTVTITGGGGTGATATAVIAAGGVSEVTITNRGSGFTSPPTIGFTGGGGTGATAEAELMGFPSPHIPTLVFMDQYVFLAEATSNRIWNSDVTDPKLWTITNFLTAEQYGDSGVALTRQINQIVALNVDSTEYFYNAQNLLGSPLGRTDQGTQKYGCRSAKSVSTNEDFSAFIGHGRTGSLGVYVLKDFQIVKISHENIDRILNNEADPSAIIGNFARIKGHLFYVVKLSSRTFAYDMFEKSWCEFTSFNGSTESNFVVSYVSAAPTFLFGQHETNGTLLKFDQNVHTDVSGSIKVCYYTNPFDMENRFNKRMKRLEVLSDKQTTSSPLLVEYTDDDYNTFRGVWTIDLANDRAYVANCGTFRKRALRITHTANTPFRITGFEIYYEQGEH